MFKALLCNVTLMIGGFRSVSLPEESTADTCIGLLQLYISFDPHNIVMGNFVVGIVLSWPREKRRSDPHCSDNTIGLGLLLRQLCITCPAKERFAAGTQARQVQPAPILNLVPCGQYSGWVLEGCRRKITGESSDPADRLVPCGLKRILRCVVLLPGRVQ